MKIASVSLKQFKRFADLRITDIPASAKLVVIVGPNGSGKSSLFEAFNVFLARTKNASMFDPDYHAKVPLASRNEAGELTLSVSEHTPRDWSSLLSNLQIAFHDVSDYNQTSPDPAYSKAFYIRSGYRNEADFSTTSLNRRGNMLLDENRPSLLISPDSRVSDNYARIVSAAITEVFKATTAESTTVAHLRERLIGEARASILRVLPQLELEGVGDPLGEGTFFFKKGGSSEWRYKNLSGGEKAAFDLLLDFVVKKEKFDNTVFCIDEPETHMNTAVQAGLLNELYSKVPDQCQLWISTHSIGMMRAAKDLADRNPGSVAFLDFADQDFDQAVEMKPAVTDRKFWKKTFAIAIGDLAELVAPQHLVFCEGTRVGRTNPKFDARCYGTIFAKEYPDVEFVSLGGTTEIEKNSLLVSSVLADVLTGIRVSRVIDLDDRSTEEIAELAGRGTRVLSRRDIESFLYDDEILGRLCAIHGQPEMTGEALQKKAELLASSVQRGNPADDIKSIGGSLYVFLKRSLGLTQCGDTSEAFCIATLAPLVTQDTGAYRELRQAIFGTS
jgi:hypothetical protein